MPPRRRPSTPRVGRIATSSVKGTPVSRSNRVHVCSAANRFTPARESFSTDAILITLSWALLNLPFLLGHAYIPWDSAAEFFPQAQFVASAVRDGQAPWWNPFLHGGQPVLGDPQGMIFTPQVLVGIIAGTHFSLYLFDMTSLCMELVGGIALARYARTYSDTRTLPILGAVVFIAGGVATSRLQHVPQIVSYSLLPLQLLSLRAVCLRPTLLRTVPLACVLTTTVLNPNQVVFLSIFALLPFAGWHLCQSPRRAKAILALTGAGVIVVLAASPVLAAISEFMSLSNRTALDLAEFVVSSFPAFNLASVFLPGLYGVLSWQNGSWAPPTSPRTSCISDSFRGVVLLSSLFCLRRMPAITLLCLASLAVWFIFAMGTNAPLYPFLFHHMPVLSAFRRPADGGYFLNLFLALLVGSSRKFDPRRLDPPPVVAIAVIVLLAVFGTVLGHLVQYARHVGHMPDLLIVLHAFAWRFVIVAPVGLALMMLDHRSSRWLAGPLVIGLTIADLAYPGRAGSVFGTAARGSEVAQVYSGTLSSGTPLQLSIAFLQQNTNPADRMEALGGSLGASMPMAFRIQTTQGYDPLSLRSYNEAIGTQDLQNEAKQFTPGSPNYDSPDYRRLGLRFVLIHRYIAQHPQDFGGLGAAIAKIRAELSSSDWARLRPDAGGYEIWVLRNAMPRAVLDGSGQPCDLVSYGTTSLSVRCHAAAPERLVLGEVFAPGWLACVDGAPVTIEPYQGIFRSVMVPAGDSRIEFRYQPVPFLRTPSCEAS